MPRPTKAIPSVRREIQFSPENIVAMESLFHNSLAKRGVRYGAISAFVDGLVSDYFKSNPVVSGAHLLEKIND